ncbi:MAG: Stp1/IreP family PP2C-type Ser/Thr phosphatase [Bdellovibrionales bacterium]|nr:Stp1/IreP family PP2C-type Ser/Thr phosphatase [Bdellovibrionales bacterium]
MSVSQNNESQKALTCVQCFYGSDVGRCREENQDTLGIIEHSNFKVFLVADGMGGVKGGSIASRLAVDVLTNSLEDGSEINARTLITATNHANSVIFEKGMDDSSLTGMGTTLVGLAFVGTQMWVLNVGDSRAYRVRKNQIKQLTTDHTLISELLRSGAISADQVSNHPVSHMLTRSLGPTSFVEVDCGLSRSGPIANDIYLLCSDGLYNHVSDGEIVRIVSEFGASQESVDQLIKRANQRGGTDNITIVVVSISADFPVTSIDQLEGEEDPDHSSTLEMFSSSGQTDNENTLELDPKIKTNPATIHRERLMNRYKLLYHAATEGELPASERKLVKVRFIGTLVALLLVMVGSYQLGFLFAGNSKSTMIGKYESDTQLDSNEKSAAFTQAVSKTDTETHIQDFSISYDDLDQRLRDVERSLERLDKYLILTELPDKSGIAKLIEKNDQAIATLETELIGIRTELDVVTRELALWYGRRQRIKEVDGLRIAKEVATGSEEVRVKQKDFEETTWAYLNAAERLRYNPKDKALRDKVYELKARRLELRDELSTLVAQAIVERVESIDKRVARLTINRESVERELSHLQEEKLILEKIRADKPQLINDIVHKISEERNLLKIEQQDLKNLMR